MRFPLQVRALVAALTCVIGLAACGTVDERRVEYRKSQSLQALELPPDMLKPPLETVIPAAAAGSPVDTAGKPALLPVPPPEITVRRDGALRWLVVQQDPATLWPRLRAFLEDAGFTVTREDATVGVLETDWAEGRGALADQSWFRKSLDFLHDSSTRDKYRLRLERGAEGAEIYLAHLGLEQVIVSDAPQWRPRASDPQREAEMLARLALYLGLPPGQAPQMRAALTTAAPMKATANKDSAGHVTLTLPLDFASAWRRVGLTLDHLLVTVTDHDRVRGVYNIRAQLDSEAKGWMGRLFTSSKDGAEYQLVLHNEGDITRLSLLSKAGAPDDSDVAQRFLERIRSELK